MSDCTRSLNDGVTLSTFASLVSSSCAVAPSPLPVARCLPNRADFRDRTVYAGADHRGIVVLPIGDCD